MLCKEICNIVVRLYKDEIVCRVCTIYELQCPKDVWTLAQFPIGLYGKPVLQS